MTTTRLLRAILLCPIFMFIVQYAWAQKTVTGKVSDEKGAAIVGASVLVKGTKTGTATDANGDFKISVPAASTTLQIMYVGFAIQEIDISSKTSVEISLVPQNTNLTDVVVTGYGTSRKKDLTGAVANVTAKDFNQGIVTNPIQQIQGKVAGLVITTPGSDPNQAPLIRLRGQTSLTGGQTPLIVVDDVPLDDPNQLNNIPAGDISSYDILKDASATAIYGSRGANGVIIVRTKKGQSGQMKVEYNGYVGMDKVAKKYDMLSADEWRQACKDLGIDPGSQDKGANTDWQDAITRTAYTNSHNLAISGGQKGFSYRASVSYLNQEGVVINTGKESIGLRFNAQQKALHDKLEFLAGIVNTETRRDLTDYGNINKPFNTSPAFPVYNPDGSYFDFYDFEEYNAVQHINEEYNKAKEYLTLMYGTINYELFKGFKVGVTGSTSHFNSQTHYFQPSYPTQGNPNRANDNNYNTDSRKGDIHINYVKQAGDHNFTAVGVYEYNYFVNNNFGAGGQQFIIPQNLDNNLGSGNSQYNQIGSYKEEYKLVSFLGRLNYNYQGKYYVTASMRRDGSSKFGENNRWGNFPSFDVAWRLSQGLLKGISWINDLKIRGGYGVTGNSDAIDPYTTLLLYGPIGRYYNAAAGTYPQSYTTKQNQNPDLKWEERHGTNIGIDFSLFNNRLSGDVNWFNDKTVNLLFDYSVPVPPYFIPKILANVGELSNKGVEVALSGQIIKGNKFTWSASGQITFIKTRVERLEGTFQGYQLSTDDIGAGSAVGRGLSSYPITYLKVGYAPYVFYLPHYVGINSSGEQLFDSAGVKALTQLQNPNPTKYYTDPSPDFTWGLNNNFAYGNWSLNFFLRGVSGQKLFNNTYLDFANIHRLPGNNVLKEALTNGIKDPAAVSDLWLEKASFLRLDNATLAYTFQHVKGLSSLRVYVSGNNLFVITDYKGVDPEIQTADTGPNQAYIDISYYGSAFYPKARSFALGVNVSF